MRTQTTTTTTATTAQILRYLYVYHSHLIYDFDKSKFPKEMILNMNWKNGWRWYGVANHSAAGQKSMRKKLISNNLFSQHPLPQSFHVLHKIYTHVSMIYAICSIATASSVWKQVNIIINCLACAVCASAPVRISESEIFIYVSSNTTFNTNPNRSALTELKHEYIHQCNRYDTRQTQANRSLILQSIAIRMHFE